MDWEQPRSYEAARLAAIATLILFIGVYLGELESTLIPILFVLGAVAATAGFFVFGRPFRPATLRLGEIVLRYHLPTAALLVALAPRPPGGAGPFPEALLYALAAAILGQELRARRLRDWRLP